MRYRSLYQLPTMPYAMRSAEYVFPAPDGAEMLSLSFTCFLVAFLSCNAILLIVYCVIVFYI